MVPRVNTFPSWLRLPQREEGTCQREGPNMHILDRSLRVSERSFAKPEASPTPSGTAFSQAGEEKVQETAGAKKML